MKYSLKELFCNMPLSSLGRVFNLPETIYTDRVEAEANANSFLETVTLEEAFDRISTDIHEDS